ncbi:MAG: hypothetical protein A2942_02145 [Candidatus Lloydbacteria bacterium RIFCSPLOWO2_01_FULL_50_20]|uniref:Uncharacterized protein n=1 Tax=Candidatus Lloydbacteria bacterium RIFCSPLOWO2_01_FULL_50_20 TaxID=1798665 RepID=A0A1G2DK14_9BACT|nr:MAG: hypothetical protein A3C13_04710 [Candidatus Lloydbacteria bacterium RIFCSPHIGHO2_02_FULL_50_11]OGZ13752.1 MAG: hypothetical protein A2942_02145 [Candidatus Lloydbacteria bacterium RIFCSPLOWO2_01_FULL_50_20]
MKVPQIAPGSTYENKKGDEVREVVSCREGVVRYLVVFPRPQFRPRRPHSIPFREFSEWAARPAGKKEDVVVRSIRLARARGRKT